MDVTPIYVGNSLAVGIANNTIKRQRSHAMNMCYFWIVNQVTMGNFEVIWVPVLELENLEKLLNEASPS